MRPSIKLAQIKNKNRLGYTLIVFSKDRPMQLQAMLDSVAVHAPDVFTDISVLFLASDVTFDYCYEQLSDHYTNVKFIPELNFCEQINQLVDNAGKYLMFLTDDDIIYKKIYRGSLKQIKDDVACFSYRLGRNITYCYSNDRPNTIGEHAQEEEYIIWDWTKHELDFGYPLSVTSHAFKRSVFQPLIQDLYFDNPNVFEGKIQQKLHLIPAQMAAYVDSRIVGVPANKVNNVTQNRHGLKFPYSTLELNEKFLNNQYIDISAMDFSNITAAQQEIKYEFENMVG
jgi:hypothetical protein